MSPETGAPHYEYNIYSMAMESTGRHIADIKDREN